MINSNIKNPKQSINAMLVGCVSSGKSSFLNAVVGVVVVVVVVVATWTVMYIIY